MHEKTSGRNLSETKEKSNQSQYVIVSNFITLIIQSTNESNI